jgi:hypothetical protein
MENKEKRKKNKISKYDIVKVTVHLDQHFFVFSRYILANVLRVIKVTTKLITIIHSFINLYNKLTYADIKSRRAKNKLRPQKILRREPSARS